MKCYEDRQAALESLGFVTDWGYLKSALWSSIKKRVRRRDDQACCACGGRATQVHHRSYSAKVLSGGDLSGLVSICDSCHSECEFDRNGQKNSLFNANQKLNKRIRRTSKKKLPSRWCVECNVRRCRSHRTTCKRCEKNRTTENEQIQVLADSMDAEYMAIVSPVS